jgi:predicted Zn-dependent protease
MLDADFDRQSSQRFLLRTHELGHALGYHHVESRPSVMNPRVGNSMTEFDRNAVRYASQNLRREIARPFTFLHTSLF